MWLYGFIFFLVVGGEIDRQAVSYGKIYNVSKEY